MGWQSWKMKPVKFFVCGRCSHEWQARGPREENRTGDEGDEKPRLCPKCKSAYWDLPPKGGDDEPAPKVRKSTRKAAAGSASAPKVAKPKRVTKKAS